MNRLCASWLFIGVTVASLWAISAEPTDFSRMRGLIQPTPSAPVEIVAFELDADIYETGRSDFGDIRIFRDGTAVPHIVERAMETSMRTAREIQPSRRVSLREEADNRIEVVFELLGDDPQVEGLEIVTPLHDFDRDVRVWTGPDGITWEIVVPQAQVCDYARFMDFDQREVIFPAVNRRYIKLEISSATVAQTGRVMEFPETKETAYRIVIRDGDNPPLDVTGVKGQGNVYRTVFIAKGSEPHLLYYGAQSVKPADYDVATVLGQVRRDYQPVVWTMETPRLNPACSSAVIADERGAFFKRKSVLVTGIILVVLALGWALIRAVRHTETATTDQTDDA
ncbi:MAG: hypothetical protein V1899_01970 [Planctomycetota bacterium]